MFTKLLLVGAAVWVVAGAWLAALGPSWAFVPAHDVLVWVPIGLTMALIAGIFFATAASLFRGHGVRCAIPLAVIQLLLFAVLFFQIASHLGVEHYEYGWAKHWSDWLAFTTVHAVEGMNLIDGMEGGWKLASFRPHSAITTGCVIALHTYFGLLMLCLLVKGCRALMETGGSPEHVRQAKVASGS